MEKSDKKERVAPSRIKRAGRPVDVAKSSLCLPAENLVAKRLYTCAKLNNDDGEDEEAPKHKDKSPYAVSAAPAARLKYCVIVVAEERTSNGDLSDHGNEADEKPH